MFLVARSDSLSPVVSPTHKKPVFYSMQPLILMLVCTNVFMSFLLPLLIENSLTQCISDRIYTSFIANEYSRLNFKPLLIMLPTKHFITRIFLLFIRY
jgi:hypothetical protein